MASPAPSAPRVPFIDLSRLVREIAPEVERDWKACLDACDFVGGARVTRLEGLLAAQLGVPHVVACANGTDALIIGLQALGVRAGMKVALPNLTFWATYEAIVALGAQPVLVDIDPDDLQMSLDALRKAHDTHRFEAAIMVHLFGWASARLGEMRALCKERGVALLEDGAQSYGVRVNGEPVLAGASAGTLSFYPAKVVGGAMDGGGITLQTKEHESLVRSLCNHGRSDHYSYARAGWNSRMGGLQASFLTHVVAATDRVLASRRAGAAIYRELLGGRPDLRLYGPPPGVEENGYLCVVTSPKKDGPALAEALKAKGIGAARTYPETLDIQPPAKGAIHGGDLSVSRAFCGRVVNLPLFYGIERAECELAANALIEAL